MLLHSNIPTSINFIHENCSNKRIMKYRDLFTVGFKEDITVKSTYISKYMYLAALQVCSLFSIFVYFLKSIRFIHPPDLLRHHPHPLKTI